MKNVSLVFVALLACAAAGCKKKTAGSADCGAAINHSMELSKADMQKQGTDPAMFQKMADLGLQHCKDDKWSAEAIKCMIDAKTMTDSQGCYEKLTQEQRDTMNKAAMEMMTPAAGSGSAAADTAGSAAGSDAGSAAGSAGSADAGSAAGSADGSAAGSAAATGSGSAGSAAAPK